MAKKIVRWTELHYFEAEIEIPDGLDPAQETDWVLNSPASSWAGGDHCPCEISTAWDSFEIDEEE